MPDTTEIHFDVTYTEAMAGLATWRFWTRYIAWHGFLVTAVMVGITTYLLLSGNSAWYTYVMLSVMMIWVLIGGGSYFVYRYRALQKLRAMKEPVAHFTLTDSTMAVRSDLGSSEIAWRAITKIWTFPEFWLLFFAEAAYSTLPKEALSDEAQQFIIAKVRENGGKIE